MGCGISPGFHVLAEEAPDDVVVDGQAVLREHRVAELLELFQDFVIDAGVVVIRAAQQHHAQCGLRASSCSRTRAAAARMVTLLK